jgi:hypothetical protein
MLKTALLAWGVLVLTVGYALATQFNGTGY